MPAFCGYLRRSPSARPAGEALNLMISQQDAGAGDCGATLTRPNQSLAVGSWQFGRMSPLAGTPDAGLILDGFVVNRATVAALAAVDETTASDAQLLLSLWRHKGVGAMADVEGDFNLLVVDGEDVHLVSSRMGARHLYWHAGDDYLVFATRMSAFTALPEFVAQTDRLAVMEMFNFGYVGGDRSMLSGVRLLKGATAVRCTRNEISESTYWRVDYENTRSTDSFDDLVDEGIAAYRESVAAHIDRFDQLTIPLSGGLDSRTLLAFAARQRQGIPVHHCSWYEGEARIARQLAHVCHATWHDYDPLHFDFSRVIEEGDHIAQGNIHCHQFWFLPLVQAFASQADVVLDGYLMDVLFGDTFLVLGRQAQGRDELRRIVNGLWRRCRPELVRRVFGEDFYEEYEAANQTSIDHQLSGISEDLVANQIQAFSFQNRSNRYSVALPNVQRQYAEYAYPGTSRRLLDLYRRIPPHFKEGAKFSRAVLSRAEPGVACVDWAKTGRPVTQDKGRIDRLLEKLPLRQAGSMLLLRATAGRLDVSHRADLNRHFRRHPGFRQALLEIARDERTFSRGLIDGAGLNRLVTMIDRGWPVLFLLQALVTVELFHRRFADEDS